MGQQVIITVLGMMVVVGIVVNQTNTSIVNATEQSVVYFAETQSKNISFSTSQLLMVKLAKDPTLRINTKETSQLFGGDVEYTVKESSYEGDSVIVIAVRSIFRDDTSYSTIHLDKAASEEVGFVPKAVKGSLSMRSWFTFSTGHFTLDGRDHDKDGNLIPGGGGTFGVFTTGFALGFGNTMVGGFDGVNSLLPSRPPLSGAFKLLGSSTDIADQPDDVMGGAENGYPQGTLKTLAKTGIDGSQYVTDPSQLKTPLKGITYVELPDGADWKNADIEGEGMLIVSNSKGNAEIKNVKNGTFKGVLVADQITKLDTRVLGSVVTLSKTVGYIGSGDGEVLYSSDAIKNATKTASSILAQNTGKVKLNLKNFGFGKTRMFVRNWYE